MTEKNPYNGLLIGKPGDSMSFLSQTWLSQAMESGSCVVLFDSGPANAKAMRALFDALSPAEQLSVSGAVKSGTLELNPFALAVSKSFDDK